MLKDVIEEIMKPYNNKKKELETINNLSSPEDIDEINNNNQVQADLIEQNNNQQKSLIEKNNLEKAALKLRLDSLRDNKEKEIAEYIKEYVGSNSNFYAGYGAVVKKDLEQSYLEKEQELENRIKTLEEQNDEIIYNIEEQNKHIINDTANKNESIKSNMLEKTKYNKVYLREMLEIKEATRKKMFIKQNELNLSLQEKQNEFDTIMLKQSRFKYEYNDQHQVINGNEWRKLYDQSSKIQDEIKEIRTSLDTIAESLKNLELTEEEKEVKSTLSASMSPLGVKEYYRPEELNQLLGRELEQPQETKLEPQLEQQQEIKPEPQQPKSHLIADDIIYNKEEPITIGNIVSNDSEIIVDNYEDLINLVYSDIINSTTNINGVRLNGSKGGLGTNERYFSAKTESNDDYNVVNMVNLGEEPISLPNGEYLNSSDIKKSLDNYYNKNKGKKFVVRKVNNEIKISKDILKSLKSKLKKCSIIKLIKDNKINGSEIEKIFGQEKADQYINKAREERIGAVKYQEELPEGEYVNKKELLENFQDLFKNNKASWLKRISSKIKNAKLPEYEIKDEDYETQSHKVR